MEEHQGTQRRAELEESRPPHDVNSVPVQSAGQVAAFFLLLVPMLVGLGAKWVAKGVAGGAARALNGALDIVTPDRKKPY